MDGIVIINKPSGCTSHDIVNKIRKNYNIKKVGHTGTLDPLATGVLPILLGDGTRISKYLVNHDKEYIAVIKLGIKTDTGDIEGKIIEEKKIPSIEESTLQAVLKSFEGKQKQMPPMYSAIKVNGKKLYEYARNGQEVEVKPREIGIYKIELLDISFDEIKIKVECSKGTYIRVLCEDIAKSLNTVGTMSELKRTKVGEFCIENAIDVDQISYENIITIEQFFKNEQKITLKKDKMNHFINGVKLTRKEKNGLYRIYNEDNEFIGIGEIKNNLLKREYVKTSL